MCRTLQVIVDGIECIANGFRLSLVFLRFGHEVETNVGIRQVLIVDLGQSSNDEHGAMVNDAILSEGEGIVLDAMNLLAGVDCDGEGLTSESVANAKFDSTVAQCSE